MKSGRGFLSALAACSLLAATAFAQVTGQLNGTVEDASGGAIASATVRVYLSGGASAVAQTESNPEGFFTVPALRADTYDVEVEAAGFSKNRVNSVRVDPTSNITLRPFRMEVAAASGQTIEVSAAATAVQITSTDISSTLTSTQLRNLPILDRQISVPFITQPGFTGSRTSTTINGLRPSFTNLTLDGINVQDSVRTNALDFQPNRLTIGQIAEITFSTSNLDSTIGGNAANISLVSPSGTNVYHGNAYWYNRNSHFAANDWFNNQNGVSRPFLNLNQLGGTIDGPVRKDKLLFFSNYETYRKKATTPRPALRILTPTARQGILRYGPNGSQTFNVLAAAGVGIDPFIANLLSQVPTVGNTSAVGDGLNTTGYIFNSRSNNDRDNVSGKLDSYLTTRHSVSVSYFWNREVADRLEASTFTYYTPVGPTYNDNANTLLSAAWRWTPSSSLTNELRGGFDRQTAAFSTRVDAPKYYVTNLLFASPFTQPQAEVRKTNTYSIQDNANWVHGNHNIAFGFQAALYKTTDVNYTGTAPSYGVGVNTTNGFGFTAAQIPGATATEVTTATNLLVSLAGILNTATQTFNPASKTSGFVPGAPSNIAMNVNNLAPYFRDLWRVRPNLTITLGLRWEYWGPVSVANGLMVQPRLINGNTPATLLGNATLDFVPDPLYKRDLNNFAPNVGFAWNVFGNGKTALRGSYSIGYANDNLMNDITNSINNGQNNGLVQTATLGSLKGFLNAPPALGAPAFGLPRTSLDNFNISPTAPPSQGLIDPNLATPYVQQWNLSLQQEVKGFVLEARYVGNHTVKQLRLIDYNQIDITRGGFLTDFLNAQNNGVLALAAKGNYLPAYDPSIPGSKPLPFLSTFTDGGQLTSAANIALIRSGEPGTLVQNYQTSLRTPPGFSFFPNPYVLVSGLLTNLSNSSYNALQTEVTKRMHNGMVIQGNYTFSKALSDALAVRGLEAQLDNSNPKIEKARAPFDTTHSLKVNHYIPLSFGGPSHGILARVAKGWALSGFLRLESGPPVSILALTPLGPAGRGTLNRGARSTNNTADTSLDKDGLKEITGLFKQGDKVYWIDPKYINPVTGAGVAPDASPYFANQVFFNPRPGSVGSLQRRLLDGPAFMMYDLAVIKDTRISERQSIQLRADFYNLFNHPSFFAADQNINSASFGQITAQNYTNYGVGPRLIQFGLMYKF